MIERHEGHISNSQGVILLFSVLASTLFLQFPEYLVDIGGPAAWQVAIIATAMSLLLYLPVGALGARFPGRTLAEISHEVAGPFFGSLLTLVVIVWLSAEVALTLRNFTETFITTILPRTPPSILILGAAACAAYASYRGLESLARATQILVPLITAGALSVLILVLPRADLALLYPFWGHGLITTVTGGLYFGGIAADAVILLAFGYAFRDGRGVRRAGILGILFFGIIAVLTVAVLVAVLGSPDAAQVPFPMFILSRLVHWGRFLQRTEALVVMLWFFAAVVRLSALLHAVCVSVGGLLRLPHYRPVVFPLVVILISFSLIPKDFTTVLRQDRDLLRPLGLIVLAVPILLLLVAMLRGKGGARHAA